MLTPTASHLRRFEIRTSSLGAVAGDRCRRVVGFVVLALLLILEQGIGDLELWGWLLATAMVSVTMGLVNLALVPYSHNDHFWDRG